MITKAFNKYFIMSNHLGTKIRNIICDNQVDFDKNNNNFQKENNIENDFNQKTMKWEQVGVRYRGGGKGKGRYKSGRGSEFLKKYIYGNTAKKNPKHNRSFNKNPTLTSDTEIQNLSPGIQVEPNENDKLLFKEIEELHDGIEEKNRVLAKLNEENELKDMHRLNAFIYDKATSTPTLDDTPNETPTSPFDTTVVLEPFFDNESEFIKDLDEFLELHNNEQKL